MIEVVKQTIDYFTKYQKEISINELKIEDQSLLEKKGSIFVTVYHKGTVRGSAGNIKEIKNSIANELIENTITAISKDSRFKPLGIAEVPDLKIRVDEISSRKVLNKGEINQVDPTKNGIIVIKKDYSKMACILPNIDPKLITGEDFGPLLADKLGEKQFKEEEHIIYQIETIVSSDF